MTKPILKAALRAASVSILLVMAACATCKSSDTPEQCRTKERDNGQHRAALPSASDLARDSTKI